MASRFPKGDGTARRKQWAQRANGRPHRKPLDYPRKAPSGPLISHFFLFLSAYPRQKPTPTARAPVQYGQKPGFFVPTLTARLAFWPRNRVSVTAF